MVDRLSCYLRNAGRRAGPARPRLLLDQGASDMRSSRTILARVGCSVAVTCLASTTSDPSWLDLVANASEPNLLPHCQRCGPCGRGDDGVGRGGASVREHSNWTIQNTPTPSDAYLESVSCAGSSACTAVGFTNNGTLAERWDGNTWTVQATPNPNGSSDAQLQAVSCPTATSCVAVGNIAGQDDVAVAERWDGTSWSVLSAPYPAGATASQLNAISCVSADDCIAVGTYSTAGGNAGQPGGPRPLAEHWNGSTWTTQDIPATARANPLWSLLQRSNGVHRDGVNQIRGRLRGRRSLERRRLDRAGRRQQHRHIVGWRVVRLGA